LAILGFVLEEDLKLGHGFFGEQVEGFAVFFGQYDDLPVSP
jgi:hypothetical protein